MFSIIKYTIKEFLKTSSFLVFSVLPPLVFILITIINQKNINTHFKTSILVFLIMYAASLTLTGMCMHWFNKKNNKELKNIALATTSFFKYILAIIFSYYLLFFIPFLILNIIVVVFQMISWTTIFTFLLIGIITFFMFSCLSVFLSSIITESKIVTAITIISYWVILGVLFMYLFSLNTPNTVVNLFVRILPGGSILYFFDKLFFNQSSLVFDYLSFILTIIYLLFFMILMIKYYSWI